MYLRAIFPESAFADRAIDGYYSHFINYSIGFRCELIIIVIISDLQLKILRDDSSCPGASDVVHWVRGCFEAFEKRYVSFTQ